MLEILMILSVLNMGVASAALVLALRGAPITSSLPTTPPPAPPEIPAAEPKDEEKPFKLTDKKMQEGISNLLGYQVGVRGDEE